jgi:CheY-like chemotaxis protein
MIDKVCIIIDDEDQAAVMEDLIYQAKGHQINLDCVQLNPQEDKFYKEVTDADGDIDQVIDLDEIIKELQTPQYIQRPSVAVLAFDYGLQDKVVTGFEIIKRIRKDKITRKKIVLYSATIEKVIEDLIKDEANSVQNLKQLILAEISGITDKDYTENVLKLIKEDKISLESQIEEQFLKYGDLKFKSIYPEFKGMTLLKISEEIIRNTEHSIGFQKALLESAIAHMIDLNNEIDE